MTEAVPEPEPPATAAERAAPPATREALFVVAGVAAFAVVGLAAGAIWWALAPHPLAQVSSGHQLTPAGGSKDYVAADGYFIVITGVVGLICGGLMAWRGRVFAVGAPLTLAVGGVAGALVAWRLGTGIGAGSVARRARSAAVGATLHDHLHLGAKGALLTWGLLGVLVYLVVVAWRFAAAPKPAEPHAAPEPAQDEPRR